MTTHADVARRFGQLVPIDGAIPPYRSLKASRMRVDPNTLYSISLATQNNFALVAQGYSYDTCVALLMLNKHTKGTELWLHNDGFSQSTRTHKDLYRSAYINQCRALGIEPRIYSANTGSTITHNQRHMPHVHAYIHGRVEHFMKQAAHKGLHTETRVMALRNIMIHTATAIRHMTQGIPPELIDNTLVQEFTHYKLMAETMMQTPDKIKAAAQGWLALNDVTTTTSNY